MKAGKEEMVGLMAAVEWYIGLDQAELRARAEKVTSYWVALFNRLTGVSATREFPSEAGQALPRVRVRFDEPVQLTGEAARLDLLGGDPPISVAVADESSIYLNPETLKPDEEVIVARRLTEIIRNATPTGALDQK
jgi:L-seryl-tRNA(Ser) seleniumtransferase